MVELKKMVEESQKDREEWMKKREAWMKEREEWKEERACMQTKFSGFDTLTVRNNIVKSKMIKEM